MSLAELWVPPAILSPWSEEALGGDLLLAGGAAASSTVPIANQCFYYPFSFPAPALALKMWWWTGSTNGANADCGIFRADGTKFASTGSTALGTVNIVQEVDITDIWLPASELLYVGIVLNNVGGRLFTLADGLATRVDYGCAYQAGTFPLPATATFNPIDAATNNNVPVCGIAFRTKVA